MKHTEMIMVIEAHSEGKAIECRCKLTTEWVINKAPTFDFGIFEYRVKYEPKYRMIDSSIDSPDGHLHKYVSINALEDALSLSCSNDDAERRLYLKLKELL